MINRFYKFLVLTIASLVLGLFVFNVRKTIGNRNRVALVEVRLLAVAEAIVEYERTYGSLPPQVVYNQAGVPQHSWRSLIIGFIHQTAFNDSYDLTNAWDHGENNEIAFRSKLGMFEGRNFSTESASRNTECVAVVEPLSSYVTTSLRYGGASQWKQSPIDVGGEIFLAWVSPASRHWMEPFDVTPKEFLDRIDGGRVTLVAGCLIDETRRIMVVPVK